MRSIYSFVIHVSVVLLQLCSHMTLQRLASTFIYWIIPSKYHIIIPIGAALVATLTFSSNKKRFVAGFILWRYVKKAMNHVLLEMGPEWVNWEHLFLPESSYRRLFLYRYWGGMQYYVLNCFQSREGLACRPLNWLQVLFFSQQRKH